MRQSTDMMCEDNLLLVNTVKKYPCLYNFNIQEYMKKEDTDVAWHDVASCTGQSVHECKDKWRNLRYSFLRSLKPHPDGTTKKRYYLHTEMEFLIPFMKTRFDGAALPQYDDDSDDENKIGEQNGEETNVTEEPSLEFSPIDYHSNEPQPKRRKINKIKDFYECPRKMFLLGLLPEITSLTETQMKEFRRKVFTLIDDITENIKITTENNNLENKDRKSQILSDNQFVTTVKTEPI